MELDLRQNGHALPVLNAAPDPTVDPEDPIYRVSCEQTLPLLLKANCKTSHRPDPHPRNSLPSPCPNDPPQAMIAAARAPAVKAELNGATASPSATQSSGGGGSGAAGFGRCGGST